MFSHGAPVVSGAPVHKGMDRSGIGGIGPTQEPGPLGMSARALSSKLLLVYHPDRVCGRTCLDLHNGRHGLLARASRVWALEVARDVVASIGGVALLFPLMFITLIANADNDRAAGGGGDEMVTAADGEAARQAGRPRSGCLSMLLSILARMLRAHEINQRELYRIGGETSTQQAPLAQSHDCMLDPPDLQAPNLPVQR